MSLHLILMAIWLSTCTHKQFPIMHIHAKNSYCQEEKNVKKKKDISWRAVWTSHIGIDTHGENLLLNLFTWFNPSLFYFILFWASWILLSWNKWQNVWKFDKWALVYQTRLKVNSSLQELPSPDLWEKKGTCASPQLLPWQEWHA